MHGISSRLSARKSRRQSAGIKPQRQKLSFFKTLKSVLLCSFYSKENVVNEGKSVEVNKLHLIFKYLQLILFFCSLLAINGVNMHNLT